MADYIAGLKALAHTCDFGTTLTDMLCDRFVMGLANETTHQLLLAEADLTFNPQALGEGEISLPHSRAIFSKHKNEDKDLFLLEIIRNDVKKHKMQLFPFRFHLT